jgi:hypothetical protein
MIFSIRGEIFRRGADRACGGQPQRCDEGNRRPIRYGVAKRVGEAFDINQRWLATSALPVHPYIDIAAEKEAAIPASELFSLVYSNAIKNDVTETLKLIAKRRIVKSNSSISSVPDFEPVGGPYDQTTLNIWRRVAHQLVSNCLYFTPPELRLEFVDKLRGLVRDFARVHREAIRVCSDHERRARDAECERVEIANEVRLKLAHAKKKH